MDKMPVVKEFVVETTVDDANEGSETFLDQLTDDELNELRASAVEELTDLKVPDEPEPDEPDEPEPDEPEEPERPRIDNTQIFKSKKTDMDLKVQKVKKPKRVITDEHRERLRLGREKALANRRAKAKTKQKVEPIVEPIVEEKVNNIVNKESIKPVEVIKERIVEKGLSKEEIIEITTNISRKVLEDQEVLRLNRKKEKVKLKEEEEQREKVRQTIRKATSTGIEVNNPWANCY